MGKAEDRNAVVDSHGRVFGVERLRVVDISIFPLLPPGHVQSSVCKCNMELVLLAPSPQPPFVQSYPSLLTLFSSR